VHHHVSSKMGVTREQFVTNVTP